MINPKDKDDRLARYMALVLASTIVLSSLLLLVAVILR